MSPESEARFEQYCKTPPKPRWTGEARDAWNAQEAYWSKRYEELRFNLEGVEKVKASFNKGLHPNGDGPKKPSLCDLVGFALSDIRKLQAKVGAMQAVVDAAMKARDIEHEDDLRDALFDLGEALEAYDTLKSKEKTNDS